MIGFICRLMEYRITMVNRSSTETRPQTSEQFQVTMWHKTTLNVPVEWCENEGSVVFFVGRFLAVMESQCKYRKKGVLVERKKAERLRVVYSFLVNAEQSE